MESRRATAPALAAAVLLLTAAEGSGQFVPMGLHDLVASSGQIVRGQVIDQRSRWVSARDERAIVTVVTLRVERTLKGDTRLQIPLEFLGGTVGDVQMVLSHIPQFAVGERVILFLDTSGLPMSPVVGGEQGRFQVVSNQDGTGEHVVDYLGSTFASVSQIGAADFAGDAGGLPLSLASFESEISRVVQELQ